MAIESTSACACDQAIPFRRREFEVNALAREIVRRAALFPSICWGGTIPEALQNDDCAQVVHLIAAAGPLASRASQIKRELVSLEMCGVLPLKVIVYKVFSQWHMSRPVLD